jgi:hypothetical protein
MVCPENNTLKAITDAEEWSSPMCRHSNYYATQILGI